MHTLIKTALLSVSLLASPAAFAQSDVQSDVNAIRKDDAALEKDHDKLAAERDAKAADKANADYGKQAVDSVKIGTTHTEIGEKNVEKDVDTKILKHHEGEAAEDAKPAQ